MVSFPYHIARSHGITLCPLRFLLRTFAPSTTSEFVFNSRRKHPTKQRFTGFMDMDSHRIHLVKLARDLTRPHPKWWFSKGNPFISVKSRLVKYHNLARSMWMFPKMVVPNNNGVFLLKMIILGCFGGTPIFGNTHVWYIYLHLVNMPCMDPMGLDRCEWEPVVYVNC